MITALAHAAQQVKVTKWGWFWLAWIFAGTAVELYWVAVNTANTLSEQIWGAEGIDFAHPLMFSEWTPLHWTLAVVLWLFFGWLSLHFPFGWLRLCTLSQPFIVISAPDKRSHP